MIIDRIRKKDPDFAPYGHNVVINDAIIFFINESVDSFHPVGDSYTYDLPSRLPFDNLFLQFSDCGFHCVAKEFCEGGYNITVTFFYSKNRKIIKSLSMDCIFNKDLWFLTYAVEYNKNYSKGLAENVKDFYYSAVKKFLSCLSCKNIKSKSMKRIKKRSKNNIRPLSSHYVLQIKQSKSSNDSKADQGIWSNRVHLCRGHIKTYTEEKPLFGKYVGNVWCPPHARGNKEMGVINKDYAV